MAEPRFKFNSSQIVLLLGFWVALAGVAEPALAGTYSNGVYEEQYFGGQATLRFEFRADEAIPISIREVVENYGGYVYPYTYFLIHHELRASIITYSVSGSAQVTLTRSSEQFDWSSRRLISANPFRMQVNTYYRFQLRASGQPDVYAYFTLEQTQAPPNVEMEVSATPWLDLEEPTRALIPADRRFPAKFKISLVDADSYPKEPFTEPQSVFVTLADSERGTLESLQTSASGRQITLTTDDKGEAEFQYVYLGNAPQSRPLQESIAIECPALGLEESASVSIGLKPEILEVVKRWDSRTQLPRTMGLRVQVRDEFWPDLDYLEYNRRLSLADPEGETLGVFLTTTWLNPPDEEGHIADFLEYLQMGFALSDEDEFYDGRGYVEILKGRYLFKAIDSPAVTLEMRFPAHVFVRPGTRWLTARLELIVAPEEVASPLEKIFGTQSNTIIYAVDVMRGGESVLQSIACSFQPTTSAQYWVKYTLNHDYFKHALEVGGGAGYIVSMRTVQLFDLTCEYLQGNYFNVMQALVGEYLSNLDALRESGELELSAGEARQLARYLTVSEGKDMYDVLNFTADEILGNQDSRFSSWPPRGRRFTRPSESLPEIPPGVDLAELRQIFNESLLGLLAGMGEEGLEIIAVSNGTVQLLSPDSSPYPEESILAAVESEGSKIYLLPENTALLAVEHSGALQINRFLYGPGATMETAWYSVGDPQAPATSSLDCSQGLNAQLLVDAGSNGSVDETLAPATTSYTPSPDDLDGVAAAVEDQGPNGGDANRDGLLDSTQPNVASLPNAVDSRYVTLVSPAGTRLRGVQALEQIEADPAPEGVSFPLGLFEFHVEGLETGGSTTVEMLLPEGVQVNSYYIRGSTSGEGTDHWYAFPYDQETGSELEEDLVRLHFRDAGRGDSYPFPDGVIIEPGGPAFVVREDRLNFAQFATGGGLFSEVVLLNLDAETEADVEVYFRDDDGQPLSYQAGSREVPGFMHLSIPAAGMRVFQTDGGGVGVAGSADVRSSRPLAGVLIFGGAFGLAGVGDSQDLTVFSAPMEKTDSRGINTGIAVMNAADAPTDLDLRLRDADGEELATASESLPGRGHKAVFVDQFDWSPPVDFSDFRGVLEASSSGPIGVTVLQTRPGQFATMPVAPPPGGSGSASPDLNFAQFATGGGLSSEIILLNLDAGSEAQAEVHFRDDVGNPSSFELDGASVDGQLQLSIPASGVRVLQTDGSGPPVSGSARVSSDAPLAGVLVFGGSFGLAGVGSSQELTGFLAPMERIASAGINTGIAVMNGDDSPVNLDLRLLDVDGRELATANETIPARGHKAVFVNQFDWSPAMALADFRGIMEVTSSGRIAVTVLQIRPGQYATMPVGSR